MSVVYLGCYTIKESTIIAVPYHTWYFTFNWQTCCFTFSSFKYLQKYRNSERLLLLQCFDWGKHITNISWTLNLLRNLHTGSVVCQYTIKEIDEAYKGDYYVYNYDEEQWNSQPNPDPLQVWLLFPIS